MEVLGYVFLGLIAAPFALVALMMLGGILISIVSVIRGPRHWKKTVRDNSVTYSFSTQKPKPNAPDSSTF